MDRRQRVCPTAWCSSHKEVAFDAAYCRRHVGIIQAFGAAHLDVALPDRENRAPSLATWVGRDLDAPTRTLLQTGFPNQTMNVATIVSGGTSRERSWGRSWKIISPEGVDCSVTVTVLESDDCVVRVAFDGKEIIELTPPWIAARRQGMTLDAETDRQQRLGFYHRILEALEDAVMAAKQRRDRWHEAPPV